MVGRRLVGTGKNEFQPCRMRSSQVDDQADGVEPTICREYSVAREQQDNSQFAGFDYKLILPKPAVPDMLCFYSP
jgi:hypothetical protein